MRILYVGTSRTQKRLYPTYIYIYLYMGFGPPIESEKSEEGRTIETPEICEIQMKHVLLVRTHVPFVCLSSHGP